jgi:RNA polymerase sigma factor (sigma-70 family)
MSVDNNEPIDREKLVLDNMNLIPYIAREFSKNELVLEELVGEGTVALVQASRTFDEKRGTMFTTYAGTAIRNAMKKHLRNTSDNTVSFESVVNDEGLPLSETLADPMAVNPEKAMLQRELIETIKTGINRLEPREAWIIKRYFGLECGEPMSAEAIGEYIGLTRGRVSQLLTESLEFLRRYAKKT